MSRVARCAFEPAGITCRRNRGASVMDTSRVVRVVGIPLVTVAMYACSRGSLGETRDYQAPAASGGAIIEPPKDDARPEIVSWVDGQVITHWPAESANRQHALDAYLDDADPGH